MAKCDGPYNGSDAILAFAEEAECGVIPDNSVVSKWSNFGLVTKITPHYKKDNEEIKVVGRRGVAAQRLKGIEAGVDVDYNPTLASLLSIEKYALGGTDGEWHNYAPTRSIEVFTWNERLSTVEYFSEFFRMSVLDELSIEINAGELITVSEKLKSINMDTLSNDQKATRYAPDGTTILGDFPDDIDPMVDEPLSAEDCDIMVAHPNTDDFTGDAATTKFVLTAVEDSTHFYDAEMITVYIDDVIDNTWTFDDIDNSINFAAAPASGASIHVEYFIKELVSNYSKVSLTIGRDSEVRKGIVRGVKTGYTVRPKGKVLKASITMDFNTVTELERMKADEYMHFIVVIANREFRFLYGKWQGEPPPYDSESLIEHSLESVFSDIKMKVVP